MMARTIGKDFFTAFSCFDSSTDYKKKKALLILLVLFSSNKNLKNLYWLKHVLKLVTYFLINYMREEEFTRVMFVQCEYGDYGEKHT